MTSIFVISDLHGHWTAVKKFAKVIQDENPDILLICGDLTHFGNTEEAKNILKHICMVENVYFVPGNCDPYELLTIEKVEHAINIHLRAINISNITIVGLGGSPYSPFNTSIEWDDNQMCQQFNKIIENNKIKGNLLILCTHTPPFNTNIDLTFSNIHIGSRAVRDAIEIHKPILGLHGHVHESAGFDYIDKTFILNPGPGARGNYSIVEIESRTVASYKMKNLLKI